MSTIHIISTATSITYEPMTPNAGTKIYPNTAPMNPPPERLLTLSLYATAGLTASLPYTARYKKTHMNHINTKEEISFKIAKALSLFDTAKKVPTSKTIGNIYATIPNTPKRKPLTVPPTWPPMPILLINSRMETATTIQRNVSFLKAAIFACSSICSFFVLRLDEDFFLAAM